MNVPPLLVRVFIAPLVGLYIVWAAVVGPIYLDPGRAEVSAVGGSLLRGEVMPEAILQSVYDHNELVITSGLCYSAELEYLLIIKTALSEYTFERADPDKADAELKRTKGLAEQTLHCNPNSSIAWTVLGWEEFLRNDRTPAMLRFLDMSYRTGPFEGWPSARRLFLLFPMYEQLSEKERDRLQAQVRAFLDDGLYQAIVLLYNSGTDAQKAFLQAEMARLGDDAQQRIATIVDNLGGKIDLPAVESRDMNPFKRR